MGYPEYKVDKNRKWQQLSDKVVKTYCADLRQSGTDAPVATELYNDTEVSFTYQYVDPGVYVIIANKDIFTGPYSQKVQVSITNTAFVDANLGGYSILAAPSFFNTIVIVTSDTLNESDDILGNNVQNMIKIEFFN